MNKKLETIFVFVLVTLAILASLAMAALAPIGEQQEADYFKRVANTRHSK